MSSISCRHVELVSDGFLVPPKYATGTVARLVLGAIIATTMAAICSSTQLRTKNCFIEAIWNNSLEAQTGLLLKITGSYRYTFLCTMHITDLFANSR